MSDDVVYFSDIALQVNFEKNHAQLVHGAFRYRRLPTRTEAAVANLLAEDEESGKLDEGGERQR
jgi:hypothetical protein